MWTNVCGSQSIIGRTLIEDKEGGEGDGHSQFMYDREK